MPPRASSKAAAAPPAGDGRLAAPAVHAALVALAVAPALTGVPVAPNIVATASLAVLAGAARSVKPEPPAEAMSRRDALRFPLVGSAVLFSLFLAFRFLPKELVNRVLGAYFLALGVAALVATAEPLAAPRLPARWAAPLLAPRSVRLPRVPHVFDDGAGGGGSLDFTGLEAALAVPAAAFCGWYVATRHWLANNALGLAFAVQGVEHLSLGAVSNGVILLAGLFFYDVFWVFCTPVMVSVARGLDAPIKLLFPRPEAFAGGAARAAAALPGGAAFSMLGLGDIVIPGIFVAIVLRYDAARAPHGAGRPRFFVSAMAGYVAGLAATIAVMNAFQAAQPALLYIVPAVLGATGAHAAAAGEFAALLHWSEAADGGEEEGQGRGKAAAKAAGGTRKRATPAAKATPRRAAAAAPADAEPRRATRSAKKGE